MMGRDLTQLEISPPALGWSARTLMAAGWRRPLHGGRADGKLSMAGGGAFALHACGCAGEWIMVSGMVIVCVRLIFLGIGCGLLTQCASFSPSGGKLGGPTIEERQAKIASEPAGDYYVGRRYFVDKTRFWGYLREPRQPWSRAKLVMMREDEKLTPDRFSESGPASQRYAFDNNFEYRIRGSYTGDQAYDPNSNQFLAVFMLTDYELIDRRPGWLFRPDDRYVRNRITMIPR